MGNLEIEINKKLKNLNMRRLEVTSELNYFHCKKNKLNFSISIVNGEGKNYCILNNIVNIDALEKLEMSKYYIALKVFLVRRSFPSMLCIVKTILLLQIQTKEGL